MTDDDRPFTRVSSFHYYVPPSQTVVFGKNESAMLGKPQKCYHEKDLMSSITRITSVPVLLQLEIVVV
jgi:hypothetical protein